MWVVSTVASKDVTLVDAKVASTAVYSVLSLVVVSVVWKAAQKGGLWVVSMVAWLESCLVDQMVAWMARGMVASSVDV